MAEYIEREMMVENVLDQMRVSKSETAMRERLLNLHAADVRPVVLCRDCKHSAVDLENMRYCKCVTYYNHVQDDWFCADGEKKEES